MEDKNNDYRLSFFKPNNEYSRSNRNLVFTLVIIWAMAVFGFHILMRIIEKPKPEEAMIEYQKVKTNVFSEKSSVQEKQKFCSSVMSVLGKAYLRDPKLKKINKDYQEVLNNTLGWISYSLMPKNLRKEFENKLKSYNSEKTEEKISEKRGFFSDFMEPHWNFIIPKDSKFSNVKKSIFIYQIKSDNLFKLPSEYQKKMDVIMELYLVHNQSFLTDTKFLGFPFHYFYSAIFLLVLFVFLCWVYAYQTEVLNKKFSVEE
ncbi:MAG: hypothetical protein B6I24_08300 [Bacteroidetes bacterium 4572_128]|nr:MAG: hypothetical protein B6I24_08300 [Bacteroidetes bacterium 4572_128]